MKVCTNNREVYEKLNELHFKKEVCLKNVKERHITKMLNSVNMKEKILEMKKIGNDIIIRKLQPLKFNVYLTGGQKC